MMNTASMKTVIVRDGKSTWGIRNTSAESRVCAFAFEELRKYLKIISGCPLSEGSGGPNIILGLREDLHPADEAGLPRPAEGFDGFTLAITAEKIVIAGENERGLIYGVYDLLERIGCRWFYPQQDPEDTEVVPRMETIELEPVSFSIASPIKYRICNASSFFFEIEPEIMKAQLDAAMKARYNGMGWQCDHRSFVGDQYNEMVETGVLDEMKKRGMLLHGPAHSFPHFLPNDLFDEYPEWFGMREGKRMIQVFGGAQFCWSNHEARKTFIDNAEKFVLDSPGLDIFCTLGFDGGPACACPECAKSTPADLVFLLMNELIERLEKSAPHMIVETSGGYNPVHEPPQGIPAHPKLRVIWAHWGRYHGMGYDDDRYPWKPNLETWRKAVPGRLTLCQYYTDNFATPWISAPYPKVIAGDRRYILETGIDAVYMLMWAKGYWWNHSFNNYMAGVCFYDASRDPWEIIRDYAHHYFGPDAGPLLAQYLAQWVEEIDLPYHVRDGSNESERQMLADQRRKWIPSVEAVRNDPVLSHRVGKVEKLHRAAERLSSVHVYREKVAALREAGEFGKASELVEEARTCADGVIAFLAELAALDQGLIDRKEVPGFISLGVKGWIEKEEKLISARTRTSAAEPAKEPDSMETLPTEVTEG